MFAYILSFFRSSEPELSLEECSNILSQENSIPPVNDYGLQPFNEFNGSHIQEYNFSTKKGIITARTENAYTIDDLYKFVSGDEDFSVGATVTYQRFVDGENIIIYNVTELQNEWDNETERDSYLTTRVIICKVEKRDKRLLFLSHDGLKLNLDKVSSEFVPIVGDWIELEVKCELNEETIDLSGKIIDINKLMPLRPHIITGQISHWNALEKTGNIERNIFFNQDSLSCGYIPVLKDKVTAEIIESDQSHCKWRAIKVVPESMNLQLHECNFMDKENFKENHSGVDIMGTKVIFTKLGESKEINITLKNTSGNSFNFLNVKLSTDCTQLSLSENYTSPVNLKVGESLDLKFLCTAKNIGTSNELILLHFENFIVRRYINIEVQLNIENHSGYYKKNEINSYRNMISNNNQIIRGQRVNNIRFKAKRIPDYAVPKNLLNLIINYSSNKLVLVEELRKVKRSLFNNLNHINYEEKFHTLLHLDEISNLMSIRKYDQERACFIQNGEYLMLEIENLAERRPSIVLGDKIQASDPSQKSTQLYEGNVFKVGAKHVYLKFSEFFHQSYNGEDYSVTVIPGRSSYKRQHHSVFLAARNLGRHWLFPSKIDEKPDQIKFWCDPYPNIISNKDNSNSKTRKTVDELKNLVKEARRRKELEEENKNILKLEWYNKTLNCKQKDAVVNILKGVCRPLPYIIFGPPGTGKTVTMIESILQIARMIPGSRLLVTAPSNSAADLLALKLIDSGVLKPGDLVRLVSANYAIGEQIPAKLLPYCATGSIARADTVDDNIRASNGMLLDCSRKVLGRHRITVSTCSSSGLLHMMDFPRGHFSHIFVDEAGQAPEPEVLIPLSFLNKYDGQAILAGDPMQLGPVVLSQIASDCGLNESFLERLLGKFPYVRDLESFPESEGFDPRLVTKLLYNYRSLEVILNLFGSLFYNEELIPTISADNSKEYHLLQSLSPILPKTHDGNVPSVVFHRVEGQNFQSSDSPSWYNPHEAAQIFFYVNELYRMGLKAENVGIISPYVKQVREIRQLLLQADFDLPKLGTVEDFQGQEFDVVLVSMVRSGQQFIVRDLECGLGFVGSPKRLNVAISRPKSLLVIVGNPSVLEQDVHWRTVIKYCMEKGAYVGFPL